MSFVNVTTLHSSPSKMQKPKQASEYYTQVNKVHVINESLSRILQILSVNVFQKVPFNKLLADYDTRNSENDISKQLVFSGF